MVNGINYWPNSYSKKAIILSIFIVGIFQVLFSSYMMPMFLLSFGIIFILLFYLSLSYFSIKWREISEKTFYKKVFIYSFIFRFIFVLYHYAITKIYDPASFPMEISAADTWTYHLRALELANIPISYFIKYLEADALPSDWGFPFYLGIIYKFFGPYTFPVRVLNCLWSSLTVIFLSKSVSRVYTFEHARLTGIILMLIPSLSWFAGIQLKETLMIFIVIVIFYLAIYIMERRKHLFFLIVLMLFLTISLYYFRPFLVALVLFSTGAYFGLSAAKKNNFLIVVLFIALMGITIGIMNQLGVISDLQSTYDQKDNMIESNVAHLVSGVGNIDVKNIAVLPLIMIGAVVTPFPSFLNLDERQVGILCHFQNEMIRNFMYFFAFLGLFHMVRNNFKKSSIFVLFAASYIYVLAMAGSSYEDRFQLPALPFIVVMIAVGIIESNYKWLKRWNYYLIIIIAAQIAWNLFKLNIRGL